jgi:hypothetical protein
MITDLIRGLGPEWAGRTIKNVYFNDAVGDCSYG